MTTDSPDAPLRRNKKMKSGSVPGKPKLVEEMLEQVRNAAHALYKAAIWPLPEGLYDPPDDEQLRAQLLVECKEWQHRVAKKYGQFVEEKPNGEVIFTDDSLLQALEYMYVEDPNDESEDQIIRAEVPGLYLGTLWREVGPGVGADVSPKRGGMEPVILDLGMWKHNFMRAKFSVLLSRNRALRLVQKTYKAISDYESITTPRFRITFVGKEDDYFARVVVIQAGHKQTINLTKLPSQLLRDLVSSKRCGVETVATKHDLIEQLQELNPFVHAEQRKRAKSNRVAGDSKVRYHLVNLPTKCIKVLDERIK